MSAPRPCPALEAVDRALRMVGRRERYVLGCGDYEPGAARDEPFTTNKLGHGCDCWGLAGAWAYKLPRHRPGYNKGPWATVSDDINCDAAIEQAEHAAAADRLWEVVDRPRPGHLLVYPSIRDDSGKRIRIGHVGIVVDVPAEWDPKGPQYGLVTVVQCQATRAPAIIKGPGTAWFGREHFRGMINTAWRTRILRVVP